MITKQQTIDAIRTFANGVEAGHVGGSAINIRRMADRLQRELDEEKTTGDKRENEIRVFLMVIEVCSATGCTKDEARDALILTLGDISKAIKLIKEWKLP